MADTYRDHTFTQITTGDANYGIVSESSWDWWQGEKEEGSSSIQMLEFQEGTVITRHYRWKH